jgi:Uma2 family endonuclease
MAAPGPEPKLRLFNRDEYYRMAELEILGPDEKTELIDGHIICKTRPMTASLAVSIHKSVDASRAAFAKGCMAAGQYPLVLSKITELEPDVLVVAGRPDDYGEAHPGPADALLVIEIADHPNTYDREWKARLYAESDIADYWFINLVERNVEVRRQPEDSEYLNVGIYGEGEAVASLAAPASPVCVSTMLPLPPSVNKEALSPK